MDTPPESISPKSSVIKSPTGNMTPKSFTENMLQRTINHHKTRSGAVSPSNAKKVALLTEFSQQHTNDNAGLNLALLLRQAEKGKEPYDKTCFDKVEFWAAESEIIKAAHHWAYTPATSLSKHNLNMYESAAYLVRKNGDENKLSREKISEQTIQLWNILYDLEKTRNDRIIDNPALRVTSDSALNNPPLAAAIDETAKQTGRKPGFSTLKRFGRGHTSGGSSAGNSRNTSPRDQSPYGDRINQG